MIISVGATATPDLPLAQAIQNKYGGFVTQQFVDVTTLTEDLVVIGGQEANPVYADLVNRGLVPTLRPSTTDFGSIFYFIYSGHKVWVCSGWSFEGTSVVISWILDKGFPLVDRIIPFANDKEVLQLNFPNASESGLISLRDNLSSVINFVTERTSVPIIDTWVDVDGRNLFILKQVDVQASVVIETVVAGLIVLGIITVVGILIWKGFGTWQLYVIKGTTAIKSKLLTQQIESCDSLTSESERLQCLNKTLDNQAIDLKNEGSSFLGDVKQILIIGLVGTGLFMLYKAIATRKGKGG